MTITMPETSKLDLLNVIKTFIDTRLSCWRPLVEWQCLLGWINWALNVFPLLKPALQSSYDKILGKAHPHTPVYLNWDVIHDLSWLSTTIGESDGICMLDVITWEPNHADLEIFCNATPAQLGFYSPAHNAGFVSSTPASSTHTTIFFYEALCVVSALA